MVFVRKLFAKVRIISGFFLFLHLNLNINECNVAVKNKDIIANFDVQTLFQPKNAFIVGDGGISIKDFLSMDIRKLF